MPSITVVIITGWNPWGAEEVFPHPQDTNSEVWSSADGKQWTLETYAPWTGRHCAGWLVHDDGDGEKLFVVGGDANPPVGYDTDVWSSTDGRACERDRHGQHLIAWVASIF